jgi:hypothetical protein
MKNVFNLFGSLVVYVAFIEKYTLPQSLRRICSIFPMTLGEVMQKQ